MTDAERYRLFDANRALAHWAVRKFLGLTQASPDYEDRVQDASVALWRATAGFDAARGIMFSTFAGVSIMREILHRQKVANRCGFSRTGDAQDHTCRPVPPTSLDADLGDGLSGADLIPAADTLPDLDAGARSALVWAAVGRLRPRWAVVLTMSFREGLNLRQIAKRLGVTHERVRQVREAALTALRAELEGTNAAALV